MILFYLLPIFSSTLIWAVDCEQAISRKNTRHFQNVERTLDMKIRDIASEMIKLADQFGYNLDGRVCRGATGTMKKLIKVSFNFDVEPVRNQSHTFLILRNYYGTGNHLVIDPTFQQYVPMANRTTEKVFVGSETEMIQLMISMGVKEFYWKNYFSNLQPDSNVPSWF
ncbi:MAG: hypothetical protein H6625_12275 [Bdellovibrionaceae bacterium]|nr:hypothetical protein [Pseudobdellovibrionaceae bacterium]